MKGDFVDFVRNMRDPVRARRQEKLREVELTWSDHDLANFRIFAMGLPPAEMADVCYAFADATALPLLELLVGYAEVNNDLMLIALQSIGKAPVSARLFLTDRLFASSNAMIRAGACDILGGVGPAAADRLIPAIADSSDQVKTAAVKGLVRIGHVKAGDRIVGLLGDKSPEIRSQALDALIHLKSHSPDFEREALAIFAHTEETDATRGKAADALAGMGSAEGRRIMLEAISGDAPIPTKVIAARTLAAYRDAESIEKLLLAANADSVPLAAAARRSLVSMPSEILLPILRDRLTGAESGAIISAELLGETNSDEAEAILTSALSSEKRWPISTAIADALGKSGRATAWAPLMQALKRGLSDPYPLVAALADVSGEEHIDEFSSIIDILPDGEARDLAMRRLAGFCLTVRPSYTVQSVALALLDSGRPALVVPAVKILVHSSQPRYHGRILVEMAAARDELPARQLLGVMLKSIGGELAALFREGDERSAVLAADAAAECESIGSGGAEFLDRLAGWVARGAAGAAEGLAAAAKIDPAQMAEVMLTSPNRVPLLRAWAKLDLNDRLAHTLSLENMFTAADTAERSAILDILEEMGEERHLRPVSTQAFLEQDAGVKAKAVKLVRRLARAEEAASS